MSLTDDQFYGYRNRVDSLLRAARGNAYQDAFWQLMVCAYGADFVRTKPAGNIGDRKNDGYLKSDKRLFAVYAPITLADTATAEKLASDFQGGFAYWGPELVENWTFVHNGVESGLPPSATKRLMAIQQDSGVVTSEWGHADLLNLVERCTPDALQRWLGPIVDRRSMLALSLEDVRPLLDHLVESPDVVDPSLFVDLRAPAVQKAEINGLNRDTQHFLQLGRLRTATVDSYIRRWVAPGVADRIAEALAARYRDLRVRGHSPNAVFAEMLRDLEGTSTQTMSAALAVLSYFFDTCDIFERDSIATTH